MPGAELVRLPDLLYNITAGSCPENGGGSRVDWEYKGVDDPAPGEFCPYCMSRVTPGEACPVCGLTKGSYTPAGHHLPPGTILMGRYLVGRVLGEGGFGITYMGRDLRLEMKVAIKEYFPSGRAARDAAVSMDVNNGTGGNDPGYEQGLNRFLYEARTMARMEKQPQIVMVRDFFEANNTAYIVMEYVEGTNFIELASQHGGKIPAAELFRLMEPLFTALSAMHRAGLIHRDISPDNLMLEQGSVRLLDFGCAHESSQGPEIMGVTLKQGYAPIEQYQSMGQGPWTDVYALSATIYFCLTGIVPPKSLDRLLSDRLAAPRDLGVDITPGQQRALLKGMEINPEKRFQSVDELHTGLYHPDDAYLLEKADPPAADAAVRDVSGAEDGGSAVLAEGGESQAAARGKDGAADTAGRRRPVPGRIMALAGALLCAAVLALFILGDWRSGPAPVTAAHAQEWTESRRDELFADALTVSTETELAFALADSTVTSVILDRPGDSVSCSEALIELDKPLLISEGTRLYISGAIILRENGVLWVAGDVADGGALIADGGALVAVDGSFIDAWVYLLSGNSLIQDGANLTDEPRLLSAGTSDAGVQSVSTFDELRAASEDAGLSAIVIEGSIELEGSLEIRVPVTVSEGAVLSSGTGERLNLLGAPLINHGSIDGGIRCGGEGSMLVNYGRIEDGSGLRIENAYEDGEAWTLLNFGEMRLTEHSALWCDFLNLGVLDVSSREDGAEQDVFGFDGHSLLNFGSVEVGEGASFYMGGDMRNIGSVSVAGNMDIVGRVVSRGEIEALPGGRLSNYGVLDMYDTSTLSIAFGGDFDTAGGIFLHRNYAEINGTVNGTAWYVDFTPIDGDVPQAHVATEAELLDAMGDGGVEAVVIDGELQLTQPLTVTKPLYVAGKLIMPAGAQITVDGTVFCVNGELVCDGVTVRNGAMTELLCTWRGTSGRASLTVTSGSWVYTRGGSLDVESAVLSGESMLLYDFGGGSPLRSLHLSDGSVAALTGVDMSVDALDIRAEGSRVIQLCDLETSGASVVEIGGGSICHQAGDLLLGEGAELTVAPEGVFRSEGGMLTIADGASVLNGGSFTAGGFADLRGVRVEGLLANSGTLYVSQPVRVSGLLSNQGLIRSNLDAGEAVAVEAGGTVEGDIDAEPWDQ